MAISTALPRTRDARPATVPGGFSRDQHLVAGDRRFRPVTPAASRGCAAQFLAPPAADREKPSLAASDCGEVAMHRLRHPFTVATEPALHRKTPTYAR